MAALKGKTEMAKLKSLCKKTYGEQAKWFLNAFWATKPKLGGKKKELENVWTFCQNMIKLDSEGEAGSCLEEFTAHRFLEKNTEALTWTDMRNALKELDIDFDKKVALSEFLIHHYKVDWKHLVNSTQSCNKEAAAAIKRAELAVADAQAKRDTCIAKLEEASADEASAQKAEAEAKAAHEAEIEAEQEVKAILARIQGFQNALKKRADALQKIIDDPSAGTVKKMKAKHELMDLKNGSRARRKGMDECNPDLLRKAKIDQKAAVRKQKRATAKARASAKTAEEAREHAEETRKGAEAAVADAENAMKTAIDMVQKVKESVKGAGEGTVWWMDRELQEQKKYLPRAAFARLRKKHAKKVAKLREATGAAE
eukprot:g1695.t1